MLDFFTLVDLQFILLQKKLKVAHTRLPSVGFQSWSRFLVVSLLVTWVINPAVGCHYFLPGLQLPPQPLRGLLPICCLVNRGTMGVNSLLQTVTRQHGDCDLNPGPSAPESSTLTTRLPSLNLIVGGFQFWVKLVDVCNVEVVASSKGKVDHFMGHRKLIHYGCSLL